MPSALAGTAPSFPIYAGNLAEFVLSDPFHKDTRWIKEG
jgi:hypothetical protein